jgi:heme-degrading monooxygenase HmoA
MIRATLNIKVRPGAEDEFEQAWRTVADQVRTQPGNIRQALARDPGDASSFVVTSDWVSRDAFTEFERSPEQDDLTAPLRALRESGQMTVHDLIVHVDGRETG